MKPYRKLLPRSLDGKVIFRMSGTFFVQKDNYYEPELMDSCLGAF